MKKLNQTIATTLVASTLLSCQLLASNTHCTNTENVVFSCNTGKKVVSICASKSLTANSGYIQYRFGKLGTPEALVPVKPESFRTNTSAWNINTGRSVIYGLNFKNGNISYNMEMGDGVLGVFNKDKEIANLTCKRDNTFIDNFEKYDFQKIGLKVEN